MIYDQSSKTFLLQSDFPNLFKDDPCLTFDLFIHKIKFASQNNNIENAFSQNVLETKITLSNCIFAITFMNVEWSSFAVQCEDYQIYEIPQIF